MNLVSTFLERKSDWIIGLYEHLQISLLSLIIAIFIAVPLGIIISGNKKTSEWFLQITGIFQTIPSLALLGLFIPFTGIGTLPAVVALVIYAIFPILQSTITGLSEIDPSLEEAATAFGMTKLEKLKKFKLALAMPILMSGVRTASIMIIGTATLAALIGAGGLGSFILLGIDRNNSALILIGAISSAILAILFGLLIKFLQDKKPKTILSSLLAAVVALTISFFPIGKMSNDKLIIAGKIGAEPEILINMYKLLIEDETNIDVEVKPNFGKTSFLYEALKGKSIDIYPEFTGTAKGVTAIQMDIKISGLSREILHEALEQAHKGRMHIMGIMLDTIAEPRQQMSQYAPRIITMKIDPDKIRDVIGSGGKVIRSIIDETGAKIDIEDDGTVFIASVDQEGAAKAQQIIENLTKEVEVGEVYLGRVTRLMAFGAFVEVLPGKEGLVHISKLAKERVENVEDVVNVGDEIMVKVIEIDKQGRINLSRKDCLK